MERQQKEKGRITHWNTTFASGSSSQSQPASGRMATHSTSVQRHYTSESASRILASFGLSDDDLEELSRYPDDQLTPENMPLILRNIRIKKRICDIPCLPSQNREKKFFSKDEGRGSMVKGKVIDYGHESKYYYREAPLNKVYNSDAPTEKSMKGFQAQETASASAASSGVPSNTLNAVEELIRQMGFQRSTPNPQPFFSMDTANKVPGLCLPSAGPVAPPAGQPMMPPVVSPVPQSVVPPVAQQALPPPPVAQSMMTALNQPPPPFAPEMLEAVNRHGRIQCDSRGNPPPGPSGGQNTFQKEAAENPIESPFGVVKASWLPVFSQADAQKMKRLPTPSMMNDYYAASPRIFPHMCSLCNVECRHLKDWIQHQNTSGHIKNCRQLCQQYPDWNPEAHSLSKRHEGDRKEHHTVRRRSASPSPKRSRCSSSGHGRHRTRSRSRSPGRLRAGRPRSRSPRHLPSPRHGSRSPRRYLDSSSWSRRSCSRERSLGRSARSPAKRNIRKPGESPKGVEKEPASAKKSGATKASVEPKKLTDAKKPEEAKKALESKKTTEPKKVVESKAKETPRPAQVPGATEAVKHTGAGELVKAKVTEREMKNVEPSKERHEGDQNENSTQRQRSISPNSEQFKCSRSDHTRHQTRSRSRSPEHLRAGRLKRQVCLVSGIGQSLPSLKHMSGTPRQSQETSSQSPRSSSKERRLGSSSRSPDAQRFTQLTGLYKRTEKQGDKSAHQERCHSKNLDLQQLTKKETTSQEQSNSEALQEEQPHNDSEHAALTSVVEKSVLQAMTLLQSGGAGGVRPLAAGNPDLAAIPPDIVSIVQLVATQVVQSVVTSKKPLSMLRSGVVAPPGPGANTGVNGVPEKREEEHKLVPCSESVMVASLGPKESTAGSGPQETPSVSSKTEKQGLVACPGADADSLDLEANAAVLNSEADISVSSKAGKQQMVPCPEDVNSDAPGPEAGISESERAEKEMAKQQLVPCPGVSVAAPMGSSAAGTDPNIEVSSKSEKQMEKQHGMPCSVERLQPKVVWICGHSVVHLARERAVVSGRGDQLGLCDKLNIKWLSQEGMQWNELVPMLENKVASNDPPDVILLQLGDADPLKISVDHVIAAVRKDLSWCMQRFPWVKIIWSDLLPFPGGSSREQRFLMYKRRKAINNFVGSILGPCKIIIFHPSITPTDLDVYSKDGLSLSEKGADIWLHNIYNGLMDFAICSVAAFQPTVVWICGHNVVQLARDCAVKSWGRDQLELSDKLSIKWLSQHGMQWNELVPMLEKEAASNSRPNVIILQLGDNDLLKMNDTDFKSEVLKDLAWCMQQFPGVKIMWSVLLPFPGCYAPDEQRALNKRRKAINQYIVSFLETRGGNRIFHPNIYNCQKSGDIFSEDGLCLSEKGADIWMWNIRRSLLNLVVCPDVNRHALRAKAGTSKINQTEKAKQELVLCPVAAFQPKVVWICGHSVVQLARDRAVESGRGDQLGLSDQLSIKWLNQQGMQWNELVPMLAKEAAANDPPDVILLQLGDNDMFRMSDGDVIAIVKKDLLWCMQRFPGIKIIWSVLLQFPGCFLPAEQRLLNKRRSIINQFIDSFLEPRGGNSIVHPNLHPKFSCLYSEDGLCLSKKGADTWLTGISQGLKRLLHLDPSKLSEMRKQKCLELPAEAPETISCENLDACGNNTIIDTKSSNIRSQLN